MVKKIASFLAYFVFFIAAIIYFTPKGSIYFFLEEQMQPYDVVISSEELSDSGFTLKIENANLSFKSIESAKIDEISMKFFILYNAVDIKNITLSSTAKAFVPLHIESVNIVYSIFNPLNIKAHAVGEFGELDAKISILDKSVHIDLEPSDKMLKSYKTTMKNLTKTESGEFVYDKTF